MIRVALAVFLFCLYSSVSWSQPVHGASIYGEPKYGKDFSHFEYVNPDAPKGGTMKMSAFGTFDSFNPFIVKGIPALGISMTFDTLLVSSNDEPFSEYGLIAETFEIAPDRSWVQFNLNPKARFHDGSPITAADVAFTFRMLKEKGAPIYRYYYGNVKEVIVVDKQRIKFVFNDNTNRELPLILGQMSILSEKDWKGKDFSATTLMPPLGSGPYRVKSFEQGRRIVYERVKDYWAQDLPARKGQYNFDSIIYDYYMDTTVALQALKSGNFDLRIENEAKKWETGYKFKDNVDGFVKKVFSNDLPAGVQGYVFNTRRPIFADVRVREALGYAFDFEWVNRNLFYGHYKRTRSYFDNSAMAAEGLPSKAERSILNKYKSRIPARVFSEEYNPPASDGSGYIRENLTRALELLEQAGWILKNGKLVNGQGERFSFEILINSESSSAWERISLNYVRNLAKLGIEAKVRTVDSTQYQNRLNSFDYDMISVIWGQSLSPGSEQRYFWGSAAADMQGSRNYAGIKNPVVDELIELVISADSYEELLIRTKALDRVLQWGFYIVPHWYLGSNRIAMWDKFGMPDVVPMQGVDLMTWWSKEAE